MKISKEYLKNEIVFALGQLRTSPQDASVEQFYKALAMTVNKILKINARHFKAQNLSTGRKQINYLSIEFLIGRSLRNNLFNLKITDAVKDILSDFEIGLEDVCECEADAGLGNGGLGRLAACYLDSMANLGFHSYGYSILYEFGIFKQKIVDGWQTELPDKWLSTGKFWLNPQPELAIDVKFGGEVEEHWDASGFHYVIQKNYSVVRAIPYDIYIPGYSSSGVAVLRLWDAESPFFDMDSFNRGDYTGAMGQSITAESISKILYPNDNHLQGKLLRLRQQYFLCAASLGDIVNRHTREYGNMDNFAEKNAIHINDTHPTLAIPELMRILLDECGYSWEKAWKITENTFTYTNHTVMTEALEVWNEGLIKDLLPRIFQIILEINRRFVEEMKNKFAWDINRMNKMSIVENNCVKMANLCVYASKKINGVSELHSKILRKDLFYDFYREEPDKFTNVTNGIAYRRWLSQINPGLDKLLRETVGSKFEKDAQELKKFEKYADDSEIQKRLAQIKRENKEKFLSSTFGSEHFSIDINSIFDVQVKRMHEYKRQHMNALNIISDYLYLKDNPSADFAPKTYVFSAKAAPGYYIAKQIIKLICALSDHIRRDPKIREKLNVVYVENYNVSLAELIIPASDISEQISLAGTEASGTGNMKFMINGAITLGTEDGANVEIHQNVGEDNILIFGMDSKDVENIRKKGYFPIEIYNKNPHIKRVVDFMEHGIYQAEFCDIANSLKWKDPYMVLADFSSYRDVQNKARTLYNNPKKWYKMSAINIANAGYFSADRAVSQYAKDIWDL